MPTASYPSDLTDQQWAILAPLIPPTKPGRRPRTANMRQVINAILYMLRSGCQRRMLSKGYPPWPTVWTYFRYWRDPRRLGADAYSAAGAHSQEPGGEPPPSAAILDSQPVKMTEKGGRVATTGARKSRGVSATCWSIRKDSSFRRLVLPADLTDRDGGTFVLAALDPVQERFPRLRHL